jgi:hypothetical protein
MYRKFHFNYWVNTILIIAEIPRLNTCEFHYNFGIETVHRHRLHIESILYYYYNTCDSMSRESAAGIATGYGLDGRGVGVRVPVG